jgi:hypothetical protein
MGRPPQLFLSSKPRPPRKPKEHQMPLESHEVIFGFTAPDVAPADVCEALKTGEIVWMPKGVHTINAATSTGKRFNGQVLVDAEGAAAVQASFERTTAAGYPPWIDIDHENKASAAWVKGFSWDEARGIIAKVEWTQLGETVLTQKQYRSFSPAFTINPQTQRVSGIYEKFAAGGLVNNPAFGAAMPALIAARLAGSEPIANTAASGPLASTTDTTTPMRENIIKLLDAAGIKYDSAATDEQLLALVPAQKKEIEIEAKAPAPVAVAAKVAPAPVVVPVAPVTVHASVKENPLDALRIMAKESDATKQAAIFANVRPIFASGDNIGAILAANSLGTLAGTLTLQRSLDLLQLELPVLRGITTDYSAENAAYGQAVTTRLRSVPTVVDYNTTTGYASSDATTTDVSVTLNAHKAVQIEFNVNEIASTSRDLIAEQAEGISYALAKAFSDAIMALPNNADHGTSYKTVKALASITRADFVAMEKAMAIRGVSRNRMLWLNADVYEKLALDTSLVNLATYQKPEIITGSALPPVAGFNVFRAVNLPATTFGAGALQGVAFAPDAFALVTRLPNDYTKAVGVDGGGALSVVSHASGISFQVVKFVDHKLGKAYWRAAFMYGVANGQKASAQVLTTA